jgi:ammonia channel protein AmtB
MILVLLLFTAACIVALVAGGATPGARWLSTTAAVAIVYVVSLIVWWYALYFQVIPVYRALAALNVHRTEGVLGALIFFGPPMVPAATVLVIAFIRFRRRR